MDSSRQGWRGFTLVELLVVIGIIGVLMSILLPALGKARESAKLTQCSSNLRQWGLAYQMYADANKGFLPDDGEDGTFGAPIGEWDGRKPRPPRPNLGPLWLNVLPPLVNSKGYHEMQVDAVTGRGELPGEGAASIFVCPSAGPALPGRPSDIVQDGYYMIYGWAGEPARSERKTYFCYVPNSKIDTGARPYKMSQMRPASQVVLLTEKRMSPGELPKDDPNYDKTLARAKADWQRFAARHRKGGNLLFADGHVALFGNAEMANPPGAAARGDWNQPGKVIWNPFRKAN